MTTVPVGTLLGWVEDGRRRLEQAVDALPAGAVAEPSALPGWTRGHVLTHLARNADALVNLLNWAATGIRTAMYASPDQRGADIEAGAGRPLAEQRADLRESAERFAKTAGSLSGDAWSALVTSAQGREIPASEVPWLRVREVWIHLVDLRVGIGMDVLPPELAWALVEDAAAWMSSRVAPDFCVEVTGEGHGAVVLGPGTPRTRIAAPPHALAAWLTGRDGGGSGFPELPRWL
ncbi:maleylpyruvate isomerase family mycothiol-dependent enzyme [Streptomyces sp. NPDC001795]|uniref:maleylpyruvate isomerase family mycothiol-dependent enzyme n=1 Tax=unclassified Streptomyces TaxID=2593676 RepID=UPI0033218F72